MPKDFLPNDDAEVPVKYIGSPNFAKMLKEADYLDPKSRRSIMKAMNDRQNKVVANKKRFAANGGDYYAVLAQYDKMLLEMFEVCRECSDIEKKRMAEYEAGDLDSPYLNAMKFLRLLAKCQKDVHNLEASATEEYKAEMMAKINKLAENKETHFNSLPRKLQRQMIDEGVI